MAIGREAIRRVLGVKIHTQKPPNPLGQLVSRSIAVDRELIETKPLILLVAHLGLIYRLMKVIVKLGEAIAFES